MTEVRCDEAPRRGAGSRLARLGAAARYSEKMSVGNLAKASRCRLALDVRTVGIDPRLRQPFLQIHQDLGRFVIPDIILWASS
jgi:hypothetical protein